MSNPNFDYGGYDALGLADLIRSGDIHPRDAVDAAIAVIERHDPQLNAVVLADFDRAREAAGTVDREAVFAGVPFLVKDTNIHVAGLPTTHSCRLFMGAGPRADSEIVRRWRKAGLIILGKTNTPEFAADFVTEPTLRGPTRNPWDPQRTPGGSSGGAAAAVASGMVPMAHGTDSGGSIRVPAACCGLFGLKPTRGLTPVGPYYSELAGGLNCEHALTRTVRDSAALLDATVGSEPGGPYLVPRRERSYLAEIGRAAPPLCIAYACRAPSGAETNAEIAQSLEDAVRLLAGLGHRLVPFEFSRDLDPYDTAAKLWMPAIAAELHAREAEIGRPARPEELEALTRHSVRVASGMTAEDYLGARLEAHRLSVKMTDAFKDFDLLLTPTIAEFPPRIGEIDSRTEPFDHDRWQAAAYRFAPFTELFNITGQPAASLPLFQSRDGLPIGMQLVGRMGEDALILQIAAVLEKEAAWTNRHPPIWG